MGPTFMLVIIQYNITDYRSFIEKDFSVLPYPDWPNPGIGEFSKCIGAIEYRKKGGIKNWIGESKICSAKRCVKIDKWLTFANSRNFKSKLLFRRFYFDGNSSGKFEVGFEIENPTKNNLPISNIIKKLANLKVRLGYSPIEEFQLGNAKKGFCHLYEIATSKTISTEYVGFTHCDQPVFILKKNKQELFEIDMNGFSTKVKNLKIEVGSYSINNEINLKEIWIINDLNRWERITNSRADKIRELRISLSRIISLKKSLNKILKLIQAETILPKQRSIESDHLQYFLINAIKRLYKESNKISEKNILFLIKHIESEIFPGEAESLYIKLEKIINVRPQILDKVIEYLDPKEVNNNYINNFSIMSNNIDNRGAKNTNVNFGSGNANQSVSEDNIMNDGELVQVHKKLFEIEKNLLQIQDELDQEEFEKLKLQNIQIKKSLNQEKVPKKTVKEKFDSILDTAEKIGDLALPITKIAGEVAKYL